MIKNLSLSQRVAVQKQHISEYAFKIKNIRSLISTYAQNEIMFLSKMFYFNTHYPVIHSTVEAVLKMPQFKSVLTEEDKNKLPKYQLGKLVEYAKKQMLLKEYQDIKRRYPNPLCIAFFADLADQIKETDAIFTLAFALKDEGISIPVDDVKKMIDWFDNSTNIAKLQDVEELDLSFNSHSYVVPNQLRLCTGLKELYLSKNSITSIDLSRILSRIPQQLQLLSLSQNNITNIKLLMLPKNLKQLYLFDNVINNIDLSMLPKNLEVLDISDNRLTSIKGLSGLPKNLEVLDISKNDITSIELSRILSRIPQYLQELEVVDSPQYTLIPGSHHHYSTLY